MPEFCVGKLAPIQCQNFVLGVQKIGNKDKQSLEAFSTSPWEACTHGSTHGIWWVGNMQVMEKLMKIGSTDFHRSHRPFSTREICAGSWHSPPPPFARFLRERGAWEACPLSKSAPTSHHMFWPAFVGPCWWRHRGGAAWFRQIGEALWPSRWTRGPNSLPPKSQFRQTAQTGSLPHWPGDTGQGSEVTHTHTHHISMLPISLSTPASPSFDSEKAGSLAFKKHATMERWCLCWSFKSSPSLQAQTRSGWVRTVNSHLESYGLQETGHQGYDAFRKKARFQTKEKERAFVSMLKFQELNTQPPSRN